MLQTEDFGNDLQEAGFTFFSGVPCSYLSPLINYAINECDYVAAANEGDAVAIAAGSALGGRKSVVLMQNSGLTNATSPLTSLNHTFALPVLGFVSLRGEPGQPDEPQHDLMGRITVELLDLMSISWEYLASDAAAARAQIRRASAAIDRGQTFFFVVKSHTFSKVALAGRKLPQVAVRRHQRYAGGLPKPQRAEVLEALSQRADGRTVYLATTGVTGRELHQIGDAPGNFYMVGSMGCVSSLGLGLALARPDLAVVVVDGDGSLLMRLGSLATNAAYAPGNFFHVLLDNNAHESTGGQMTVAHNVDFAGIAAGCGYETVIEAHSVDQLRDEFDAWRESGRPSFVHLRIAIGTLSPLGRPSLKPPALKERFQSAIGGLPLTADQKEVPCIRR